MNKQKRKGTSLAERWRNDDEPFKILEEPEEDTKKSFSIYKTDDDKRLVFGWASISITVDGEQLEDRQKDMIDPEDLEEAVYDYVLNFRDTGEEHIPTMRKKGKLVESCVFTAEKQKAMGIPEGTLPIGWWIGFKIEDDAAWERVKNGTYKMFSIEGKANREPVEKPVENVENPARVAKTFSEILEIRKFNPYHDSRGRFASANSAGPAARATSTAESEAKRLVENARAKEPERTSILQKCAQSAGGQMVGLEFAVKSEESLTRKIKSEATEKGITVEEAAAGMRDVNRYTMQLAEDAFVAGYNKTMKALQQNGHEVIRVKNTLANPNAEYRGVNTNLKSPEGDVWELQFHTAKSLEIKEANHKLYEIQRLDSTTASQKKELGEKMAKNAASIPTPKGIESISSK